MVNTVPHKVDVLASYSAQKGTSDLIGVSAKGFQNDNIDEVTNNGADASFFSLQTSYGTRSCLM